MTLWAGTLWDPTYQPLSGAQRADAGNLEAHVTDLETEVHQEEHAFAVTQKTDDGTETSVFLPGAMCNGWLMVLMLQMQFR